MFKKKFFYYLKELVFVIVFMSIVANLLSIYKSQVLNKEPLALKEFKLIDNSIYKLDPAKPIVIHFWATWCPTCKFEAANIEYLSKYYNVVTVAVNSGSDYDIHKYLQEHELNFKVINDKDSKLSKLFKIQGYPTTFIYDKDQKLRFSEVGYTSTLGLFSRMLWCSL
jgi:thiol-disulfide isomerase/thioredoxin